jgi:hypothetical protein
VKASPWLRKLALAIVLLLGPLAFWLGYLALCVTPLAIANQGAGLSVSGPTFGVDTANVLGLYVLAYFALAVLLRTYTHFIKVNVTGLHNRYRDGLSRAFMIGLSRLGTNERDAVVVRHHDDVCLSEMDPGETGGPYHLINATVNLPDLRGVQEPHRLGSLEQRGRRSDFFLFSRRFCGNDRLGYCRTERMETSDRQLNLGTAMAISGAAVSTQMGQKTFNPLLNFLLAMLNVRLGYWLPSPGWVNEHGGFRLRVGPIYFLAEALGIRSRFVGNAVYLSDGGHIENLGIFELLRRRCRFVVAIDGEADPDLTFNGLAVLQRMAFTDLGARVEIDLEDIRPQGSGLSRRHFALGRIRYADGSSGEILYIKSSVTGTEPEFIREHRSRNPDFPHESTGDQFFDEAQFEAYRALGRKIGNDLLRSRSLRAYDEGPELSFGFPEAAREGTVLEFFDALREWLAPAAPHLDAFLELHRDFARVNDTLFTAEAEPLAVEAFPELADPAEGADAMRRLRLVNRQLQLMERVLLALRLDEPRNQSHPRNRGWLNLFRRWAQAPFFRQYWPLCVGNYSEALQIFGKYAFGLVVHADWQRRESQKLTGVETRSLEPFLDGGTPVQVWIGTVSSATSPASQGRFQVAVAAVSVDRGTPVLHLLRVRDTFRGMGLSNVLAEALHQQLVDSTGNRPVFTLDSWPDTPAIRRTARVLQRARFEQLPRAAR